jgi:hypothetical protein
LLAENNGSQKVSILLFICACFFVGLLLNLIAIKAHLQLGEEVNNDKERIEVGSMSNRQRHWSQDRIRKKQLLIRITRKEDGERRRQGYGSVFFVVVLFCFSQ